MAGCEDRFSLLISGHAEGHEQSSISRPVCAERTSLEVGLESPWSTRTRCSASFRDILQCPTDEFVVHEHSGCDQIIDQRARAIDVTFLL